MKTEGKSTLWDKEEIKKLVAEVKEIVSTIIHLPKEKEISFDSIALWNTTR